MRALSLLRFILDFQQTFSTTFITSWYVTFFLSYFLSNYVYSRNLSQRLVVLTLRPPVKRDDAHCVTFSSAIIPMHGMVAELCMMWLSKPKVKEVGARKCQGVFVWALCSYCSNVLSRQVYSRGPVIAVINTAIDINFVCRSEAAIDPSSF